MDQILIDLGVAALLRVVQNKKDRSKFARALAKVFAAIERQAVSDQSLATAIGEARMKLDK